MDGGQHTWPMEKSCTILSIHRDVLEMSIIIRRGFYYVTEPEHCEQDVDDCIVAQAMQFLIDLIVKYARISKNKSMFLQIEIGCSVELYEYESRI